MILIDLQKTFDTLGNAILQGKMKFKFYIKNNRLVWFLLKKAKRCTL